jgi:hypothetical protein
VELRQQRLHLRQIARLLAAHFCTVAKALNHLRLGRLLNLEPKPPCSATNARHQGLIHTEQRSENRATNYRQLLEGRKAAACPPRDVAGKTKWYRAFSPPSNTHWAASTSVRS